MAVKPNAKAVTQTKKKSMPSKSKAVQPVNDKTAGGQFSGKPSKASPFTTAYGGGIVNKDKATNGQDRGNLRFNQSNTPRKSNQT